MAGVDFTAELEILQKRELKYAALPEGVLRPSQAGWLFSIAVIAVCILNTDLCHHNCHILMA